MCAETIKAKIGVLSEAVVSRRTLGAIAAIESLTVCQLFFGGVARRARSAPVNVFPRFYESAHRLSLLPLWHKKRPVNKVDKNSSLLNGLLSAAPRQKSFSNMRLSVKRRCGATLRDARQTRAPQGRPSTLRQAQGRAGARCSGFDFPHHDHDLSGEFLKRRYTQKRGQFFINELIDFVAAALGKHFGRLFKPGRPTHDRGRNLRRKKNGRCYFGRIKNSSPDGRARPAPAD
jgi:hypothetical protein